MTSLPEPVSDPSQLRASHADRERVATVLNSAMAEGRITVPELEERLGIVYAAKTVGELEPVTRDLPGHRGQAGTVPQTAVGRVGGAATSSFAVAIMSGAERRGDWVVPRHFTAVAVMGGVELDLTDAVFETAEVTVAAFALMGGVEITVPADVRVEVTGIGIMGGFDRRLAGPEGPPGRVLRVTGLALMGGVEIKRTPRRQLKDR